MINIIEDLSSNPTQISIPMNIQWDTRINPLKTKRRLFYWKTQFVPRGKHFSCWL